MCNSITNKEMHGVVHCLSVLNCNANVRGVVECAYNGIVGANHSDNELPLRDRYMLNEWHKWLIRISKYQIQIKCRGWWGVGVGEKGALKIFHFGFFRFFRGPWPRPHRTVYCRV